MPSQESPLNNIGFLISYVLPGFAVLWGLSYVSAPVASWIGTAPAEVPTLGGFLLVTVASIATGLTTSTVRWLILDTVHYHTGLRPPKVDFSLLGENVGAFDVLIRIHYHHYLFHANSLVALVFVYLVRRWSYGFWTMPLDFTDVGFLGLGLVLFLGSRDTLRKYFHRTGELLQSRVRARSRTESP